MYALAVFGRNLNLKCKLGRHCAFFDASFNSYVTRGHNIYNGFVFSLVQFKICCYLTKSLKQRRNTNSSVDYIASRQKDDKRKYNHTLLYK